MTPSSDAIDGAILSVVGPRFQKVVMIIAKTDKELQRRSLVADDVSIAERIRAMVATGRLEGAGNLSRWRHSEVRLPPDAK
jgi:hypothetical protein